MTSSNAIESSNKSSARPFIKWAGGKTQCLPALLNKVPEKYNSYYEPFLGGGALFFALSSQKAFLSDISEELINCYTVVRDKVEELIDSLVVHKYEQDYYYAIRAMDRDESYQTLSDVEKASRFIYLNKTCFNGLYRVNSRGEFNVPFGTYKNPKILNEPILRGCSRALKGVDLRCQRYGEIFNQVQENDFVYFDPPYTPISKTSSFTSYDKSAFGEKEQIELAQFCRRLDTKGVKFLLSNSYSTFNLSNYKDFKIEKISVSRAINSVSDRRNAVGEILVSNY